MKPKAKRVVLASLLGTILFLSKTVVPSAMDKMFIIVHALLLALGALLLQKMGATYVAVVPQSHILRRPLRNKNTEIEI